MKILLASSPLKKHTVIDIHAVVVEQVLMYSFDVIKDNLGGPRKTFPHTAFFIAGTQAPPGQANSLEVMKLSELSQGEHGKKVCAATDRVLCQHCYSM
jgi:hypothetical protein